MLKSNYSFEELKFSSQLIRDLIEEKNTVEPLVTEFFDLAKIETIIRSKEYSSEIRKDLVSALRLQNQEIKLSDASKRNIDLLANENTFTITTGHQLNLLTGPLYTIYKILEVVSLTNELNDRFTEYDFVPVFWLATEDHDFEEINHINLFKEKISWNKDDQNDVIVGRLKTDSMSEFLSLVEDKFHDPAAQQVIKKLTSFYKENGDLAAATRALYNDLFGSYGLVILDGDDPALKSHFTRIMQREVEEEIGYECVMKTNEYLENNGFHQQVFVRGCNLFQIKENGQRVRVAKEDGGLSIGDEIYSAEDLSEMIADQPGSFSPNALFRPLYQETILPNLAYVGGGGEIGYWLQLGELFNMVELQMPLLRVRDSVLLYTQKQKELLDNLDVDLLDLRIGVDQLIKDIAINQAEAELHLEDANAFMIKAKDSILDKVAQIDPGLHSMVEAEFAKMNKTIEKIEARLIKSEKLKHEKTQQQLVKLRDAFFPEGSFQERYENFLLYIIRDADFIQKILSNLKADNTPFIRTIEI
ncbi:MAG: bacillithiol biosynthesis cysteine-adding enzyme BshC [Crocinitomicaceae bacterium]|nr:bacillithiol biosynthesis cysteine-adding enzyme BshC [Crocinitomicaceae bacterium]